MTTRSEKLTFPGSQGVPLAARLDLPAGSPITYALFAHCFTCSKDVAAAARISRGLVEQGIGVLRFDFTGLGASGGEFANSNFSSNVDDLVLAADMLRQRDQGPSLLVGHSLGGTAALAAAGRVAEVQAVATIGAPFDPAHVTNLFSDQSLSELETKGETTLQIGGRPFSITAQFLRDVNEQHLDHAIANLRKALLVFHAPLDELVSIDNARRIFETARHPKSFVSLDTADHLLTNPADANYVAAVLAAWAGRYIVTSRSSVVEDRPGSEEGTVVVTESARGRLARDIWASGHRLVADEPHGIGDGLGPTPYDLLLGALGACTSMTVRMYADRKQWPLADVSVQLTHSRSHADDERDCEADGERGTAMVDKFERVIDLQGALTEDQRQRLLAIANRCPVHRTLVGCKHIDTRLVESQAGPLG